MNFANKARVLIVEQDPSALHLYSTRLSKAGFEVVGTSNAAGALLQAENQRFDILITDFRLPEMDGLALVRRLRQDMDSFQSVLILDTPDNQLSLKAAEAGVFQSLVKPIRPQILQKTVHLAARFRRERPSVVRPRLYHPGARKSVSFRASEAKNEFGRLLERAIQGDVVLITKHDTPKAVLISVEEFEALSSAPEAKIDSLSAEFDALLARMQLPGARRGMEAAFHASPVQLGNAAVAAVRKRG